MFFVCWRWRDSDQRTAVHYDTSTAALCYKQAWHGCPNMWYVMYQTEDTVHMYWTTFPNTKEIVKNTMCWEVLLMNLDVFGHVVKNCFLMFYISSQLKLKLTRKWRNKIRTFMLVEIRYPTTIIYGFEELFLKIM